MHFASGIWRLFGINYLQHDALTLDVFVGMCTAVERAEREGSDGG